MRIGFLSDLHLEHWHSDPIPCLRRLVSRQALDYLVLAGDIATGADDTLRICSAIDAAIPARLRIVAGNHDLYVPDSHAQDPARIRAESAAFYARITYESAYSLLLHPIIADSWFITGLGGWYDYSFASGYPDVDLARICRSLPARHFWSDNRRIRGRHFDHHIDEARVEEDLRTLRLALNAAEARNRCRCVVTHMLPTRDLLPTPLLPGYRAFAPLFGSERYRTLFAEIGVSLSISGHTHLPRRIVRDGTVYANVSLPPRPLRRHPLRLERELARVMYVLQT